MKSQERVMCALAGAQPDRVPFCEGSIAANVARSMANSSHDLSEGQISDLLGRDVVVALLFPPYFADYEIGRDGQAYVTTGLIKTWSDLDRMEFPDPNAPALYVEAQRVLDEKGDFAAAAAIKLGVAPMLMSIVGCTCASPTSREYTIAPISKQRRRGRKRRSHSGTPRPIVAAVIPVVPGWRHRRHERCPETKVDRNRGGA